MSGSVIFPGPRTPEDRPQSELPVAAIAVDDRVPPQQETLPPLRWLLQPDADRFAHPAEIELASLLSFYGIRWAYEPTTFAVRWGSDGQPQEFVTPDFYLPDHDLYLELTTMRQRLVTRKNRKFRLLREHYPNVRVRMIYQRDFERLQSAYRRGNPGEDCRIGGALFPAREVTSRVDELGAELTRHWTATCDDELSPRPLLLGVGAGSQRFLDTLARSVHAHGRAVDHDRVDLTAVGERRGASRARVARLPAASVAGRPVLIVQEVLSTGLSAAFLESWLRRRGASGVAVCALLDREIARVVDVPLVCRGFVVPDVPLAGFGLVRWRAFRHLPFIAAVETD